MDWEEKKQHLTQLVKEWENGRQKEKKQALLAAMIQHDLTTLQTSQYTFTHKLAPPNWSAAFLRVTAQQFSANSPENTHLPVILNEFISFLLEKQKTPIHKLLIHTSKESSKKESC